MNRDKKNPPSIGEMLTDIREEWVTTPPDLLWQLGPPAGATDEESSGWEYPVWFFPLQHHPGGFALLRGYAHSGLTNDWGEPLVQATLSVLFVDEVHYLTVKDALDRARMEMTLDHRSTYGVSIHPRHTRAPVGLTYTQRLALMHALVKYGHMGEGLLTTRTHDLAALREQVCEKVREWSTPEGLYRLDRQLEQALCLSLLGGLGPTDVGCPNGVVHPLHWRGYTCRCLDVRHAPVAGGWWVLQPEGRCVRPLGGSGWREVLDLHCPEVDFVL
jgi:hypothetical protein